MPIDPYVCTHCLDAVINFKISVKDNTQFFFEFNNLKNFRHIST